jgi:hypothetical protein
MKLSEAAAAILGNLELIILGEDGDDVCGEMGEAGPGLLIFLAKPF